MEAALSMPRLSSYRHPSDADGMAAVQRYLWNVALSESLYPILQGAEIALRNSVDAAAVEVLGEGWLFSGLLRERERASVSAAIDHLRREGRAADHHAVVGRLGFGFWTSLLSKPYEGLLWPQAAQIAFARSPRRLRSRAEMSRRANAARKLRNRISHHEPIWHWADLPTQHDELAELVTWLSPALCRSTSVIDRFGQVHGAGWRQYQDDVLRLEPGK